MDLAGGGVDDVADSFWDRYTHAYSALTAATTVLLLLQLLRLPTATEYLFLLKPSERSHTNMDMATHHHLDLKPRGQPGWC